MVSIIPTSNEIDEIVERLNSIALGLEELHCRSKVEEQRIGEILEILKKAGIVNTKAELLCCGDDFSNFVEKISNAKEMLLAISEDLQDRERIGCDIPSGLVL